MPTSTYVVTSSGDIEPTHETSTLTFSPQRMLAVWRKRFDPFLSLDLSGVTLDAHAIDADLVEGFTRGGHRAEPSTDAVRFPGAHS